MFADPNGIERSGTDTVPSAQSDRSGARVESSR